ncbi:antitoxin Xre/MbcA/ParS toxin-binding domain-containing protein [Vibrio splendidus]|jgi:hypothetical protein|uniref:antitoxin Xre/MbcA/ParS toxin-binding domain-containing protein n=1 Tax=Vibrio splendidus TaxID=29497 RepID=UPI000C82DEA9|nr:antitoxin Xre/MbcA/ParS toxin-binding domain-containing protein [Vibrio splendidus]PMG61663.1 hypothetical protein BCU88_09245 [Vibrio splendidus]PMH17121.1 hypothetical protein BCU77_22685 [Vibrio splendidus]
MDESAWDNFAKLCEAKFAECTFKDELLPLCGNDQKLAAVVYYQNQQSALKWMNKSVPALSNQTPLKSVSTQSTKLKAVLVSMP